MTFGHGGLDDGDITTRLPVIPQDAAMQDLTIKGLLVLASALPAWTSRLSDPQRPVRADDRLAIKELVESWRHDFERWGFTACHAICARLIDAAESDYTTQKHMAELLAEAIAQN